MKNVVLLIEDDAQASTLLCKDLKLKGFDVICCYDGESAIEVLANINVNISIILLDYVLPKMNGISFLNIIRSKNYDTPVIMLTSVNHNAIQEKCLAIGINDYIVKPCYIGLLIMKINFILNKNFIVYEANNKLWAYENLEIDFCNKIINLNGNKVNLGKIPLEILKFLVDNRGKVISRNSIINFVWGNCYDINDRTVDAHICKIRRSLNLNCLKSVPGYGYILDC